MFYLQNLFDPRFFLPYKELTPNIFKAKELNFKVGGGWLAV
jgi:hypothetical protein